MKPIYTALITIIFFLPLSAHSQKNYVENIDRIRNDIYRIEERIRKENDTLKVLRAKIEILENQLLTSNLETNKEDISLPVILQMDGKIRKSGDPFSDVIEYVNRNDTVRLTGYKDNYWTVYKGDYFGYMSEIYIRETVQVKAFKISLTKQRSTQSVSKGQVEDRYIPEHESSRSAGTYTTSSGGSSSSRTIHTGPRGGRYYINSNGNKTYLKSGSSGSGYGKSRSSYRSYRKR